MSEINRNPAQLRIALYYQCRLGIVPPAFRKDTKISLLNKFNLTEVKELLKHHEG